MGKKLERRPEADFKAEQDYLQGRVLEIEKALGRIAARGAAPSPITRRS